MTVATTLFLRPDISPKPDCVLCAGFGRRTAAAAYGFSIVQVCLGCVDELYFMDCLAGPVADVSSSTVDAKRLRALRKQQLSVPRSTDAGNVLAQKPLQVDTRLGSRSPIQNLNALKYQSEVLLVGSGRCSPLPIPPSQEESFS